MTAGSGHATADAGKIGPSTHRPLDTNPAEVDGAIRLADRRDATEAGAEAAGHVVFDRNVARDPVPRRQPGERREHGRRAAPDHLARPLSPLQASREQVGRVGGRSRRPIVGRQFDRDPGLIEIIAWDCKLG